MPVRTRGGRAESRLKDWGSSPQEHPNFQVEIVSCLVPKQAPLLLLLEQQGRVPRDVIVVDSSTV